MAIETAVAKTGSSPHTRGAHFYHTPSEYLLRIIPAYAGSTSLTSLVMRSCWDHPRIRGEHLHHHEIISCSRGSSPHTRGAQETRRPRRGESRIIPAYAGSTDEPVVVRLEFADHPRIRGEHVRSRSRGGAVEGSSPHTRGARPLLRSRPRPRRIIPAYAGSTDEIVGERHPLQDHPRIRGEHRDSIAWLFGQGGSSPHTRGAQRVARHGVAEDRIIPAYAGSTSSYPTRELPRTDHPRIRGEHFQTFMADIAERGSSPHTRGALHLMNLDGENYGIIPAYAGSTSAAYRNRARRDGSSPHTRGAPPRWPARRTRSRIIPAYAGSTLRAAEDTTKFNGSSPHTRGALTADGRQELPERIIPAYAGSTRGASPTPWSKADHPRIRGEHGAAARPVGPDRGSSPHTRGALSGNRFRDDRHWIIPAYAGSTRGASPTPWSRADHPRIRGEHDHVADHRRALQPRIIPAYAGSTP